MATRAVLALRVVKQRMFCNSLLALCAYSFAVAAVAGADTAESAGEGEEGTVEEGKPLLNAISFGGAYAFQLERDRDSQTTGEPLSTRQNLGGFVIAYERQLIPERFALAVSKPFYFARDRFDTPFEFILKALFRKGPWEGFIGGVLTWNIRVYEREREEQEGERNKMSFGIGATIGGSYEFTRHWGLELELAYEYIPTDDIVEHEISTALSGVYKF